MKSYRDCKCPCHTGAILVHPFPCCDGVGSLFRFKKEQKPIEEPPVKKQRPKKP